MLASLIAAVASGESAHAIRRLRQAAIVYGLAGLAVLAGAVFLLIALYLYAARRYGGIEAAIGFAVFFLIVAIVAIAVHRTVSRVKARRASRRRSAELITLGSAAALALLPTLIRRGSVAGLLLAPAVAMAAYAIYRENKKGRGRGNRGNRGNFVEAPNMAERPPTKARK